MRRPGTQGVTLIELLIVIAIISLLLQLAIPAVMMAREAARRTRCQNNLRQMCLAATLHQSTYGYFPSGGWSLNWVGHPDRGFGESQPGGWCYSILPFLEQNEVYDLGKGMAESRKIEAGTELAMSPGKIFSCPSRRKARNYLRQVSNDPRRNYRMPEKGAKGDYAGSGGDIYVGFLGADGKPRDAPPEGARFSGVIFQRSEVTPAEISDGLSNTYLIGEKYLEVRHYEDGVDAGDDQVFWVGYDLDNLRFTRHFNYMVSGDNPAITPVAPGNDGYFIEHASQAFGSAHPSGFLMAMCDGSVQWISLAIEPEVHQMASNRWDGGVARRGAYNSN